MQRQTQPDEGPQPRLTPEQRQAVQEKEAENGLRQFDWAAQFISANAARPFTLQIDLILELNRLAVDGIQPDAGMLRTCGVEITNSRHEPPPPEQLPSLMDEMCRHINERWAEGDALTLSAYVMWRLNWIHPFSDGNGRTSRMLSYLVLCMKVGCLLPGIRTVPDQIAGNKRPYYDALAAADEAWGRGVLDVSAMRQLLADLLTHQLVDLYHRAEGTHESPPAASSDA